MHPISRRRFFQFAGSTLATLGFSQSNFLRQAESYGKVLAKSTSRKVALLVGINDYKSSPLQGCISDVELQRHLLQYRFGFNKGDIHTLTNSQATRENILQAMILEELEDELRWNEAFSRSPDVLAKLAATAMAEYRAGKTQELDPDKL